MGTKQPQGEADFLNLGDWNAVCWRCGSKFKASTMEKNWEGFWTCRRCWEPRQPQDFATGIKEVITPPWAQPDPEPLFPALCFPNDRTAIAGVGVAGCVIAGFIDPAYTGNFTPPGEIPDIIDIESAIAGIAIAGFAVSGVL